MKKIIASILAVTMLLLSSSVVSTSASATSIESNTSIEYLDNGYYIETVIFDVSTSHSQDSIAGSRQTTTRTKTRYYKNSSGDVMWWVSITGTFTYDGNTSTCTSCYADADAPASTWSIKTLLSSKSGNTATGFAVATQTLAFVSYDYSMTVELTCSPNGTIS